MQRFREALELRAQDILFDHVTDNLPEATIDHWHCGVWLQALGNITARNLFHRAAGNMAKNEPPSPVELFEQARPRLLGLAYRILGSRAEAEDAVQETFLRWQETAIATADSPGVS